MFSAISSYGKLTTGGVATYNGFRMKIERLEHIPGGVAAFVSGIPGESYPHPIYQCGFSCAADQLVAERAA